MGVLYRIGVYRFCPLVLHGMKHHATCTRGVDVLHHEGILRFLPIIIASILNLRELRVELVLPSCPHIACQALSESRVDPILGHDLPVQTLVA